VTPGHLPFDGKEMHIRYLLARAARNEDLVRRGPQGREIRGLFGREFHTVYGIALEAHRQTAGRRESGHPSIVHALEVALAFCGYVNSYGLKVNGGPLKTSPTPYDVVLAKEAAGIPDFLIVCMCTALLHDVVEDSAKDPAAIEKTLGSLYGQLLPLGSAFAELVSCHVGLLTNKYGLTLRLAEKHIPLADPSEANDPLAVIERGLRNLRTSLIPGEYDEYVTIVDRLLNEVELIRKKLKSRNREERLALHSHLSTYTGIMEHL
jgi:hypothetical protein